MPSECLHFTAPHMSWQISLWKEDPKKPLETLMVPSEITPPDLQSLVESLTLSPSSLLQVPLSFTLHFEGGKFPITQSLKSTISRLQTTSIQESILSIQYYPSSPAVSPSLSTTLPIPDWISCLAVKNESLLVGSYDCQVRLLASPSNAFELTTFPTKGFSSSKRNAPIKSICWLDHQTDENDFAVATMRNEISIHSQGQIKSHFELEAVPSRICYSATSNSSSENSLLVTSLWNGFICASQSLPPEGYLNFGPMKKLFSHFGKATDCAFAKGFANHQLISSGLDGEIRLSDLQQNPHSPIISLQLGAGVNSFCQPSEHLLFVGVADNRPRIVDLRCHRPQGTISRLASLHKGWVNCVASNGDDGVIVASGSADCTVRLWDLRADSNSLSVLPLKGKPLAVEFIGGAEGQWICCGGEDNLLSIFSLGQ